MAPNLKHITLLSDSLLNLEVIRPKEALNQQSQTQKSKTVISENYWEWTSEEPALTTDIFSADHIEANLVKDLDSKPNTVVTLQNASESDNYWAEQVEDVKVESQPQHAQAEPVSVPVSPVDSNNYWGWSNEQTESDNYWDTTEAIQVLRNQAVSNVYWQWSNAATENDAYWSEATSIPAPSNNNYWKWSASQHTASDRYWSMPGAIAC
jgi:hypothetical protein